MGSVLCTLQVWLKYLNRMEKFYPERVCFCLNFDLGIKILSTVLVLLRLAGLVCGGFYGPWFYLVICITGAYLAADVILLYSLFIKTNDGKPGCDFSNQKVWIWIWEIINILAIVGLIIALGWYCWLGFWAMLHDPVHFVVFLIIVTILPLTIYLVFRVFVLYTYLKEAYIDSILGKCADENEPGLTSGGRRISV